MFPLPTILGIIKLRYFSLIFMWQPILMQKNNKTNDKMTWRVMELEREIEKIQKSTKTLFNIFIPLHNWLRMNSHLYYRWSLKSFSHAIHWTILFLLILSFPLYFIFQFSPSNIDRLKAAETTYDFPRWEEANPIPTANVLQEAVSCSEDNSFWVAGNAGTVLKSSDNGETWSKYYTGTSVQLNAIKCISPSNIIAVGDSGVILQYNGLSWTQRSTGTSSNFDDIAALNSVTITAAGRSGTIAVSTDGGTTWTLKTSGTSNGFNTITTLGSSTFVALGSPDTIALSSDSGATWSLKTSGAGSSLLDVVALGSDTLVAVGYNGLIIVSTDGGQTWATKTSGTASRLQSAATLDSNTVVAVGFDGAITISTDRGQTWTTKTSGTAWALNSITIIEPSTLAAVGIAGTITVSTDGGQTWATKTSGTTSTLNTVTVNQDGILGVMGYDGTILISSDGGQTWTTKTSGLNETLEDVINLDSNTLVAVGWTGAILVSVDRGATWTTKTSGTSAWFYDVVALNSSTVAAVGSSGTIAVSTDSGATWALKTSGTTSTLRSIIAVGSNTLVAVGNSGKITFSADSGATWALKTSGTTSTLYSAIALNATTVAAVGASGKITISVDSGATWALKTSGTVSTLRNIIVVNSSTLAAVGDGGTILISADSGETWAAKTSNTGNILTAITVLNSSTLIAVGDDDTITVSTDNGDTWNVKTSSTSVGELYSVTVVQESNLIVTGYDGALTMSTDGGMTWEAIISGTAQRLYSTLGLDNNNLIVVGYSGTIIRYHSPANATAAKLLIKLPGQSFADGLGIYGTPSTVSAGESVTSTVYATDANNVLDKGNASYVSLTTTDPADSNPASFRLTQADTCVQVNRQPGDPECGIGSSTLVFHTAGTWTITASDTFSVLSTGSSSDITVLPGEPHHSQFAVSSISSSAGVAKEVTLGLDDLYSNATSDPDGKTIQLSSSSSSARFSSSQNGPWTETLDLSMPAGQPQVLASSNQTAGFYYLDFAPTASTITASASGLENATLPVTITEGIINQNASSIALSNSNPKAGESVTVTVTASTTTANPVISLYSSRSDTDQIAKVSNSGGVAVFTTTSTKAGSLVLTAKDETDNTWLSSSPTLTFSPADPSFLYLSLPTKKACSDSSKVCTIGAGENFDLKTSIYDRYSNLAANSTNTLKLSSTDAWASLSSPHALTTNDNGSHTFEGVVLKSKGEQRIKVEIDGTSIYKELLYNIIPDIFFAANSFFSSSKAKLIITKDKAILTTKVMDQYGNGLGGKDIAIKFDSEFGDINAPLIKSDNNGISTFEFTPKKEGSVALSAYNETDKSEFGTAITLEILPDTIINNLTANTLSFLDNLSSLANTLQQSEVAKKIANISTNIVTAAAGLSFIPIIANIIGSAPTAFHFITYSFSLGLETLGIRKRRRSWGRVYNSATGKGVEMALVRLFDKKSMKLVTTAVTDPKGRFAFEPPAGTYYISVSKDGFIFPTNILAKYGLVSSSKETADINSRYVGQSIEVTNDSQINLEIPVDSISAKVSAITLIKIYTQDLFNYLQSELPYAVIPALAVGLILSSFAAVVAPGVKNLTLSVFYSLITLGFIAARTIKSSHNGIVYDSKTKKTISGAVVSIFDTNYGNVKETRITDKFGRFSILAPKGTYYLKVTKEKYQFPSENMKKRKTPLSKRNDHKYKNLYLGDDFTIKKDGFITYSIPLDQKRG